MRDFTPVREVAATAYTIPTDTPEADGTLDWNSTTLVVVEVFAGDKVGLGYTYTSGSIANLIQTKLAEAVQNGDAMDPQSAWRAMNRQVRNMGREGLAATAISAVDVALWDLKAKLLDLPLVSLLGRSRDAVPIYGSGGFTSYSNDQLRAQLSQWVDRDGCRWVKMKVGSNPEADPHRVAEAKKSIGDAADLFVDANGAYHVKQALELAKNFSAGEDVRWFEEPVSSDDLEGLRHIRQHAPARMEIAAGEYGYTTQYFHHMLNAGAVDVQQADATRCGGVTGFLQVGAVCEAHQIDLSGHCAPALHLHLCCAVPRLRHLEWFHDHVRIEHMLFDGAPTPHGGLIQPDLTRPGLGLVFKRQDAAQYKT
jgi:L-alanine-DL-glutamate epimerase-like enolase superfamily enzyme